MASENSPVDELFSPSKLREFGSARFGTMKAFADALGMKPPALQGYLNGSRTPGRSVIGKLHRLGFDIGSLIDSPSDESPNHWEASEVPPPMSTGQEPFDWIGIEGVVGRKLEDIAYKFDATPAEVATWKAGQEPRLNQLAKLLDLVVTAAIGARAYAKMLSEIEAPTAHPDAVPAAGTSNQASKAA